MARFYVEDVFVTEISRICRTLEESSAFAITPHFKAEEAHATIPIAILFRSGGYAGNAPIQDMSAAAKFTYQARACEVTRNMYGLYDVSLPVDEHLRVCGAEEDVYLAKGNFIVGQNLDAVHLLQTLTKLYAKAGYFNKRSLSHRAAYAMQEITGAPLKMPAIIAGFFPARRDLHARRVIAADGDAKIRLHIT